MYAHSVWEIVILRKRSNKLNTILKSARNIIDCTFIKTLGIPLSETSKQFKVYICEVVNNGYNPDVKYIHYEYNVLLCMLGWLYYFISADESQYLTVFDCFSQQLIASFFR